MIQWMEASEERAEELFAACPGYFQRLHGHPYTAEDVRDLLLEKPVGVEEKRIWMAVLEDRTVGVVEFLLDYPQPGTIYVGLLMVREDLQGQGFGGEFYRHLEARCEGRHFRLAVLQWNTAALAFWRRMGFLETGEVRPYRDHQAILMEKSVGL